MSRLQAVGTFFKKLFCGDPTDPVKHCRVYLDKENGSCAHVDGMLCDFNTCSMRLEYEQKHPTSPPKELWEQWGRNILPNGLILIHENPDYAADLNGSLCKNGLFEKKGEEWVLVRLLKSWEIMQVEDMRDYGIIQQGAVK
ncbi:hypothetical protein [Ralstonia phage RP12]|nr:hypothetical protein FDH28_gp214 [Ralstonia phage RP12]BAW19181.1 hypothetical protein [Ralstonia phage RP12]